MNRLMSTYCQNDLNVTLYCTVQRFAFTGKERDEETGFGYFGARYMDHELTTMWLSVDPMADRYPSLSPYAYCAWNPVKLVDPNGMIIDSTSLSNNLKETIKQNASFANACEVLAKDPDNIYSFNIWKEPIIENDRQVNGNITFDGKKVSINFVNTEDNFALFEEVGHALQVYGGEIGFAYTKDSKGEFQWGTIGLDCQDEINAKQWAAKLARREKTVYSVEDLRKNGYDVDVLGETARTAYQDYKAYLKKNPTLSEAPYNDNGMIQHGYFHFKKK